MEIDRDADRALHKQLADLLRDQIHSGELAPGDLLPSETYLGQTYGAKPNRGPPIDRDPRA